MSNATVVHAITDACFSQFGIITTESTPLSQAGCDTPQDVHLIACTAVHDLSSYDCREPPLEAVQGAHTISELADCLLDYID
jgi:hypothetical protein